MVMKRRDFVKAAGVGALVLAPGVLARAAETAVRGGRLEFKSPGGRLTAAIFADSSRLWYELRQGARVLVGKSRLGISADGADLGDGATLDDRAGVSDLSREFVTRGHHPLAREVCRSVIIPMKSRARDWRLEARLYDDGFAFRYLLPGDRHAVIRGETTTFAPAAGDAFYQTHTDCYEGIFQQTPLAMVSGVVGMPFTIKLADGGYLCVTEAALYNYSGMTLTAAGGALTGIFEDDKEWTAQPAGGMVGSPWRVILSADDLNGLTNSDLIACLNPDPDPALFADPSYIKPGRALWSWWSEGTGTPKTARKYIAAAAEMGFEYILIDEGWELWLGLGKTKWGCLRELADYARPKKVGVWVWKHYKQIENADIRAGFLKSVADTGCVGVKIDFMNSESYDRLAFYEAALKDAARLKLMVNFHGANKPTGESRPYPNEMTREGIRGLEACRGVGLTPTHNVILPFVRGLAGHVDYTPCTFNPGRMCGTSCAHNLAQPIVYFSDLTHYADRPEMYLANPLSAAGLPILKSIPTVWDETVVLPETVIGRDAIIARRSGERWLLGMLNGAEARTVDLKLSFLGAGKWKALVVKDAPVFGLAREDREVEGGAGLGEMKIKAGGGLAVSFERV
jgi:alpha-glucosidase